MCVVVATQAVGKGVSRAINVVVPSTFQARDVARDVSRDQMSVERFSFRSVVPV
jgi:hypothetical protein